MKTLWKTLLITAGFAAMGAGAYAQMGPGMDDHAGMFGKHPISAAHMEERMNHHLSELKRRLHISAAQETAWTAFTTAMKPPAAALMPFPDRAEMEKLTTPERIDKMKQLRAQHQEAMKPFMDQRDDAIKTFYAALDAKQRKTFDAEHLHMMRNGPMHR